MSGEFGDLLVVVGVILLLVLCSAFFSSAETALTAASHARIRELASRGNKRAKLVEKLRSDQEGLIGSILIGNNAVNVVASALATTLFLDLFGEAGLLWATLVMTVMLVVFAEVMPKTYALNHSDKYALAIALPLRLVVIVLHPLSIGLRYIADKILGTGRTMDGDREVELRGQIQLYGADATEDESETHAMLASILDLNQRSVAEVMTHRAKVKMVDASQDLETLVPEVLGSPYTRHPAYSGNQDNIIGILHVKDLMRTAQEGKPGEAASTADAGGKTKGKGKAKTKGGKAGAQANAQPSESAAGAASAVQDIVTSPHFVPGKTPLFDQLQAFRARREHLAIVVDEYGDLLGIVTLEDIIEEIVGDIDDEHDLELAGLEYQPDGSWIVDGEVTIHDLNRTLNWNIPDKYASTIAGIVLHESRAIPRPGQEYRFHGIRFRILKREGRRIKSLRLWSDENEK